VLSVACLAASLMVCPCPSDAVSMQEHGCCRQDADFVLSNGCCQGDTAPQLGVSVQAATAAPVPGAVTSTTDPVSIQSPLACTVLTAASPSPPTPHLRI
jgi:hypothetical protein